MSAVDAIIIGAGAAGLAAADELHRAGRAVLLLEARDRIGGRILSVGARGRATGAAPIELGAEFIHGEAPLTRELLARAGGVAVDVPRRHWILRGGRPAPLGDIFEEIERALRPLARSRGRDLSFEELLRRLARRGVAPRTRQFARLLVEGFDAADPRLASARVLAAEWSGANAADAPQYRPLGGYGTVLEPLAACARSGGVRLELQRVVEHVRWRRGRAEVEGRHGTRRFRATARAALLTLPLGVLQAPGGAPGAVTFTPPLAEKQAALRQLLSGPVLRVVLRFDRPFWERLDGGRYRDATFLHAPRASFPTLWTSLPLRTDTLIAWAGGPRAERLAGVGRQRLVEEALASVRTIFGSRMPRASQLAEAHVHDWSRDPFARGAYSSVKVGGRTARARLAKPLRDTLFFAGEATDTGDPGTVEGALHSGRRAARQILEALG